MPNLLRRWGFRILRRVFLFGTVIYIIDFTFGIRRRHFGSNPLRLIPLFAPKSLPWRLPIQDREIRPEHRKWFQVVAKQDRDFDEGTERKPFYTEVAYDSQVSTLPDEAPPVPVSGTTFPPGLHLLHSTLNLLSHFDIEETSKVYATAELITLEKDDFLFGVGDPDNCFYLILKGMIKLSINDKDYGLVEVRHAYTGEVILSILKVLDVFFDDESWCKAACGVAGEKSVVLEVPYSAIRTYFDDHPAQQIPFLRKSMASLRSLYFEGFQELAGLDKQLMQPRFSNTSDAETEYFDLDISRARKALDNSGISLADDEFSRCHVGIIPGGTVITRVARTCKSLIFIVDGCVEVGIDDRDERLVKTQKGGKTFAHIVKTFHHLYYIPKGEFLGGWGTLTDCKNYFTCRVPEDKKLFVVEIPRPLLEEIWKRDPSSLLTISKSLIYRFNELCRQIDICVGWKAYAPGMNVYRKGDQQDSTFLITSGRLRFRVQGSFMMLKKLELDGNSRYGYYSAGTWFGFVESIVATGHMQKTVIADRFSEVAYFPHLLMKLLIFRFPSIFTKMTSYLAYRIHSDYEYEMIGTISNEVVDDFVSFPKYAIKKRDTVSILAVFPLGPDIPTELYCMEIMRHYAKKARFRSHRNFKEFINFDFDKENESELKKWYWKTIDGDDNFDVSMYVIAANYDKVDLWNTLLARQADYIHFVGDYSTPQGPVQYEKLIVKEGWKAAREYVFLHPAELRLVDKGIHKGLRSARHELLAPRAKNSILWLENRPWLDTHHHIRFPRCTFDFVKTNEPKYLEEYKSYVAKGLNKHSDLARLGRRLAKESTGLVLGGGGAKGATHIGVLEYIQEMDIPIDYICGVSIGSFIGALFSHNEQRLEPVHRKLSCLLSELEHPLKYIRDLTVPYSSILRGRSFNEFVKSAFDDTKIEDLWTPFIPVTTDITGNHSRAHRVGKLWFFVRASMTLTMIFPPLVNPKDKHLIMDGGYSEILPGDQLRRVGVKYLLAIDITDENGIPTFDIGYECSGLTCFMQNFLPVPWPLVPSQLSFWEQLNYISATKYISLLKKMDRRVIYIRPTIELYNGKDFEKFDEMRCMGYYSARKRFAGYHPCLSIAAFWSVFTAYRPEVRKVRFRPKYLSDD